MSEWVIVAVVGVVLLFGAKKLPDMARGLGQSMRIFKAETRGMRDEDKAANGGSSTPSADAPRPAISEPGPVPAASDPAVTPTSGPTAAEGTESASRPHNTSS